MPAPEKQIPEFLRGERLSAAHLEQVRTTLLVLVRWFEANVGPLEGDGPRDGAIAAVRASAADTTRFGMLNGTTWHPHARPSTSSSTADLADTNLVRKAEAEDQRDAEVWDVSTIGMRVGHLAGYNADDKPIFLVDGRFAVVLVRVTGNAAGGGVYTGEIYSGASSDLDPDTTIGADSYGARDGDKECYVINAAEEGQSTHDLTGGTPVSRTFVGILRTEKATDGKPVVTINGFDFEQCDTTDETEGLAFFLS